MRLAVQDNLVVGVWEVIPLGLRAGYTLEEDKNSDVTGNKQNGYQGEDKPELKQKRTFWWKKDNRSSLKKALDLQRKPNLNRIAMKVNLSQVGIQLLG